MFRNISLAFVLALGGAGFSQAQVATDAQRAKHYHYQGKVAIEGYDPVSYFSGKPLKGNSGITLAYKGITYRFATAENRTKFKANPAAYEPQYGGWCAYAMANDGSKVDIDPQTYEIREGKLYLFYNGWLGNTFTDWKKDPNGLKNKADKAWAGWLAK